MRHLRIACATAVYVIGALSSAWADAPLTSAAVIALCKAGLGEEVVTAKVKKAPAVGFSLDTNKLVSLRHQGINGRILAAMLERETAPPSLPPPPHFSPPGALGVSHGHAVELGGA